MPRDKANLRRWRKQWYDKRKSNPHFVAKKRAYSRALYRKNLARKPRAFRKHVNKKAAKWRKENPAYHKQYRAKRKEFYREYIKNYMRKWRQKHPQKTKEHMRNSYQRNPIPFYEGAARRRALKQGAEGSHRYSQWLELLSRSGFQCFYCGKKLTVKTAVRDHKIPLCRGGSDSIENIAPACRFCNGSKHSMTAEEYLSTRTSVYATRGQS